LLSLRALRTCFRHHFFLVTRRPILAFALFFDVEPPFFFALLYLFPLSLLLQVSPTWFRTAKSCSKAPHFSPPAIVVFPPPRKVFERDEDPLPRFSMFFIYGGLFFHQKIGTAMFHCLRVLLGPFFLLEWLLLCYFWALRFPPPLQTLGLRPASKTSFSLPFISAFLHFACNTLQRVTFPLLGDLQSSYMFFHIFFPPPLLSRDI